MKQPQSELARDATEFAKLHEKRRKLQSQVADVEANLKILEDRLSEAFIASGVSSMKVKGGTVHIRREMWPALIIPDGVDRDVARKHAVDTLIAMGHEGMITYNHQSVRGLLKDLVDDDGNVPPPLGEWVRAEVKHRVGVRGRE